MGVKTAARFVARLVSILVVSVAAPAAAIGLLLVVAHHHEQPAPCICAGQSDQQPAAVFVGRPRERTDAGIVFQIDDIERGTLAAGEPIEALGIELAPWRRYRVEVFDVQGHRFISAFHLPETRDMAMPPTIQSFGALRWHARMALLAVPLLVLASGYLLVSSWRQAKAEEAGIRMSGLRRLRRRGGSRWPPWRRPRVRRPSGRPPVRPVAPI
jgi:hypothetical protein